MFSLVQISIFLFWFSGFVYCFVLASKQYRREVHDVSIKIEQGRMLLAQQWFVNFFGGISGLFALSYLLIKLGLPYSLVIPKEVSVGDIVVFVIAFFGLNGHLPWFMYQRWMNNN